MFLMKMCLLLINSLHLGSTYICWGTFCAWISSSKSLGIRYSYYSSFTGNQSINWLRHVPKITCLASSKTQVPMQIVAPEAFSIPIVLTVVWPGDPWGLRDPYRESMRPNLFHNKTKMTVDLSLFFSQRNFLENIQWVMGSWVLVYSHVLNFSVFKFLIW